MLENGEKCLKNQSSALKSLKNLVTNNIFADFRARKTLKKATLAMTFQLFQAFRLKNTNVLNEIAVFVNRTFVFLECPC